MGQDEGGGVTGVFTLSKLFWTAQELAQHTFPSSFIIEPWLPRRGVAFIYGKRGIGKSHLSLTLASCLAQGGVLFGRYRTRKGGVMYVQADMGEVEQQPRVKAAIRATAMTGVTFTFPTFLSIPNLNEGDPLVKGIRERNPEVIIWDTLRQSHQLDINDSTAPAIVYGTVKEMFPGVTHLFIHHEKKTIVEQDSLDDDETFSGSGAWIDAASVGLRLRQQTPGRMTLAFTKTRTCPPQAPVTLTLEPANMLLYALGEDLTGLMKVWRRDHPRGGLDQLERFLLDSFAAPPRTVRALAARFLGEGRGENGGGFG